MNLGENNSTHNTHNTIKKNPVLSSIGMTGLHISGVPGPQGHTELGVETHCSSPGRFSHSSLTNTCNKHAGMLDTLLTDIWWPVKYAGWTTLQSSC